MSTRTEQLLRHIVADFPRRKKAVESLLKLQGLEVDLNYTAEPACPLKSIPTFKAGVANVISPMLVERYKFASTIHREPDIWLSLDEIWKISQTEDILSTHRSLRENWESSAPMMYPDEQLSLYGYTPGVPDNLVYLVWSVVGEPEIFEYRGMESTKFPNLDAYLDWWLKRSQMAISLSQEVITA